MSSFPIDEARLSALKAREDRRFRAERPQSAALLARARASMPNGVPMAWMAALHDHPPIFVAEGAGSWFTDVDGHRYLDMNQADMSVNCGYAPPPVVEAVATRMRRGSQFLLPGEDAIAAAEALARRYRLPKWQFTLSASGANAEIIRLARHATGRDKILLFDGKYHGHIDDTLVMMVDGAVEPELLGLPQQAAARAKMVPFNDLPAVERALAPRDVACAIVEPALTNVGIVQPDEGFLEGLHTMTRATGTLLAFDETHTQVCAPGGLTEAWNLACDAVALGKMIGGGVAVGAYGMNEDLAHALEAAPRSSDAPMESVGGVATGGTLYGNALSLAACRATLEHVLTPEAYHRAAELGARLADGIDAIFRANALPWCAQRLFSRSGVTFGPVPPRTAAEARALARPALYHLLRVYMANRGVWESIASAGPSVSFAATAADVDLYLGIFRDLIDELIS